MKAFIVPVVSVEEAAKLHDVLADYDLFQYENNVKPDYCNVGGLSVFEDGEWVDWECPETLECDPRKALEARAAYASTATYHNQAASNFAYDANERGLIYAIGRWADDSRAGTHTRRLRGHLVPLNAQAVAELAEFDTMHLPSLPEAA